MTRWRYEDGWLTWGKWRLPPGHLQRLTGQLSGDDPAKTFAPDGMQLEAYAALVEIVRSVDERAESRYRALHDVVAELADKDEAPVADEGNDACCAICLNFVDDDDRDSLDWHTPECAWRRARELRAQGVLRPRVVDDGGS